MFPGVTPHTIATDRLACSERVCTVCVCNCTRWLYTRQGVEHISRKYRSVWEAGDVTLVQDIERAVHSCSDIMQRSAHVRRMLKERWVQGWPWKLPHVFTDPWVQAGRLSHWCSLLLTQNYSTVPASGRQDMRVAEVTCRTACCREGARCCRAAISRNEWQFTPNKMLSHRH